MKLRKSNIDHREEKNIIQNMSCARPSVCSIMEYCCWGNQNCGESMKNGPKSSLQHRRWNERVKISHVQLW